MNEHELVAFLDQKLVEIVDVLLVYYDCCGMRDATCKAYPKRNRCCENGHFGKGLCPFWMNNKCQYSNADCKLWLCRTALSSTDPKCVKALSILSEFALLFDLATHPIVGEPYSGGDKNRD